MRIKKNLYAIISKTTACAIYTNIVENMVEVYHLIEKCLAQLEAPKGHKNNKIPLSSRKKKRKKESR